MKIGALLGVICCLISANFIVKYHILDQQTQLDLESQYELTNYDNFKKAHAHKHVEGHPETCGFIYEPQ